MRAAQTLTPQGRPTRIGALLCVFALALPLGLWPFAAAGECLVRQVSGKKWAIAQADGFNVVLELAQTPDPPVPYKSADISGVARYTVFGRTRTYDVTGSVAGFTYLDVFQIDVRWNNGTTGRYHGKFDVQGQLRGTMFDLRTPNKQVNWQARTTTICDLYNPNVPPPTSGPAPGGGTAGDTSRMPKDSGGAPGQVVAKGFAGTWDTQTSAGLRYTMIFTQSGSRISGQFVSLDNPLLNGSLQGTLDAAGATMTFTFSQPQASNSGKGTFFLEGINTISGRYTLNSGAQHVVMWNGKRRK